MGSLFGSIFSNSIVSGKATPLLKNEKFGEKKKQPISEYLTLIHPSIYPFIFTVSLISLKIRIKQHHSHRTKTLISLKCTYELSGHFLSIDVCEVCDVDTPGESDEQDEDRHDEGTGNAPLRPLLLGGCSRSWLTGLWLASSILGFSISRICNTKMIITKKSWLSWFVGVAVRTFSWSKGY